MQHNAKMHALNAILDMVDTHSMKGLKKKGAAPVAAMSVEVAKPKDMHAMPPMGAEADGKPEPDEDDLTPEMLAELLKMHGGADDEMKK